MLKSRQNIWLLMWFSIFKPSFDNIIKLLDFQAAFLFYKMVLSLIEIRPNPLFKKYEKNYLNQFADTYFFKLL
jgi:hypothetical protein